MKSNTTHPPTHTHTHARTILMHVLFNTRNSVPKTAEDLGLTQQMLHAALYASSIRTVPTASNENHSAFNATQAASNAIREI